MADNKTRLDVLRILIQNKSFDNQEDLLYELKQEGFCITQPTLSRDLRRLHVLKTFDGEGKSVYVMPGSGSANHVAMKHPRERLTQSFGFLSVDFSGNLAVLKTLHGYANSLAVEIDIHREPEILGSLAGDDTVLLVLREGADRSVVTNLLAEIIPHYEE